MVGILVGIATAGASVAVEVGASVAPARASDAVTGAVYDVANGEQPTLASVGGDVIFGAIGGAAGVGLEVAASLRAVRGLFRPITERVRLPVYGWRAARANPVSRSTTLEYPKVSYLSSLSNAAGRTGRWVRELHFGRHNYSPLREVDESIEAVEMTAVKQVRRAVSLTSLRLLVTALPAVLTGFVVEF